MILQPEGSRIVAMTKFARMIASSATFAEACGLTDVDAILEKHVHYPDMRDQDGVDVWPWAIVGIMPEGSYGRYRISGGSQTQTLSRGSFAFGIGRKAEPSINGKSPLIDFINFVDGIVDGIQQQSGYDDNLNIVEWVEVAAPAISDPKDGEIIPRYYDNWFQVFWGTI